MRGDELVHEALQSGHGGLGDAYASLAGAG